MGKKQKARTRALRNRSGAGSFLAELGLGLVAIPVLAIALLLIAVFFQVAAEMSEGVWQAVIAFGVAIAISVGALMLIGWIAVFLIGPAAIGWLAMFAGQLPEEFGAGQHNGARALANLVLFAGVAPLGFLLFRHGAREGELNWTIEGLFLLAISAVLGLGAAIPRLYFAGRAKHAKAEPMDAEGVVAFVITAMLGIGLSLGVSMGFGEARPVKKEQAMRAGKWHTRCVRAEPLKDCLPEVTLTLVAAGPGLHAVDTRAGCSVNLQFATDDRRPAPELRWIELRRLGIQVYDKEQEIRTRVLRLAAGERVRLRYTRELRGESCFFKARYRLIEEGKR